MIFLLRLFTDEEDTGGDSSLMKTVDVVNRKWGRGALKFAAHGTTQPWQMRQGMRSPRYTTNWAELKRVVTG